MDKPDITPREYEDLASHRFGVAHPERIENVVWEWMVRAGHSAYSGRCAYGIESDYALCPTWCFDRFGMSRTVLADGRTVCIAGEHEDFYDPDFCIYNDVIILHPGGAVEIFGYPREEFPPTDFHTATLVGDRIVLIGSLGYQNERHPGVTPVMSLDLSTLRITRLETTGTPPGWIFRHQALLEPDGDAIRVLGGQVEVKQDGKSAHIRNLSQHRLDLLTMHWTVLADGSIWRQFAVRCCDDDFMEIWDLGKVFEEWATRPAQSSGDEDDFEAWRRFECEIEGVPVVLHLEANRVHVVIQGTVEDATSARIEQQIVNAVEAALSTPCTVVRY